MKRIDELLLKLHSISEALKEKDTPIEEYNEADPSYMDDLHSLWDNQAHHHGVDKAKLLDSYETEVLEHWERFTEKRAGIEKLKSGIKASLSKVACSEALEKFFGEERAIG